MRIGLQYVAQSAHLKGVLVRISIFFFTSTGLIALRDRKLAFHIGESPSLVTRSVMEATLKSG
jgi:hypothetical protein